MNYYIYNYVDRSKIADDVFVEKNLFSNNIGNILFLRSVCNSVDGNIVENEKSSDIDAYIFPLANMFRKGCVNEINYVKSKLKNCKDRRIVIAGVGAQGTVAYDKNYTDEEDNKIIAEFCNTILEHSKSIGVRGEYTKNYLVSIGLDAEKIDVIGCPSVRMFGKGLNTAPKQYKPFGKDIKIAVNYTPYSYQKNVADFIDGIFRNYDRSFALMQDKVEYDLLYNKKPIENKNRVHELLPSTPDHFIIKNNRARMFLSVESWMGCLKTFDLSIGTRIHGNIIALLSGCPAMVIAIDSRTRELCEYHHIPYIIWKDVNKDTDLNALYHRAVVGLQDFYHHYSKTLKDYSDFMQKNGIRLKDNWIVENNMQQKAQMLGGGTL